MHPKLTMEVFLKSVCVESSLIIPHALEPEFHWQF